MNSLKLEYEKKQMIYYNVLLNLVYIMKNLKFNAKYYVNHEEDPK